ncbi:MAG: conjugal transfer protein TraC, partial [Roseiflexaceae bacterium]
MSLRQALNKPIFERQHGRPSSRSSPCIRSGATTLLDVLVPDGVERRWNYMVQVGDSSITTLELRGFPPTLDLAWLTDPSLGLDAPGITVHQRII